MTNYAKADIEAMTPDELNRAIGIRKGYRVEKETRGYENGDLELAVIEEYILYNSDGKEVSYRLCGAPNRTVDLAYRFLPAWATDADIALTLIPDWCDFDVFRGEGYFEVSFREGSRDYSCTGDSFSRALCGAWLLWDQRRKDDD